MHRSFLLFCFVLLTKLSFGQTVRYFNGIIDNLPVDLTIERVENGKLVGQLFDLSKRTVHQLEGKYYDLGDFLVFRCFDKDANFLILRARIDDANRHFKGYSYAASGRKTSFVLQEMDEMFMDDSQMQKDCNEVYQFLNQDINLGARKEVPLFKKHPTFLKMHLDRDEGRLLNSGLLLKERQMLEYSSIRSLIENNSYVSLEESYSQILHFQVITYFPAQLMMVMVEENTLQLDSSNVYKISFLLYERISTEMWRNATPTAFNKEFLEQLSSALPMAECVLDEKSLSIKVKDIKGSMKSSTPRSMLYLQDKNFNKMLIFAWINKRFWLEGI